MNGSGWQKWAWRAFGLAAVLFALQVLRVELAKGADIVWPSAWRIAAAATMVASGLVLASSAWLLLLEDDAQRRVHRADYFAAQLAKYVPGSIWQPLGQIGISHGRGVAKRRSGMAVASHAGLQVAAGLIISGGLALRSDLSPFVRAIAATAALAGGTLVLLVLRADRLRWMPDRVRRFAPPPSAGRVTVALLVNLVLQGVAFALLASAPLGSLLTDGVAYSASWTIGFLAIPVPAGVGVREAALTFLSPMDSATAVTASIVLRIVTVTVELLVVGITRWRH